MTTWFMSRNTAALALSLLVVIELALLLLIATHGPDLSSERSVAASLLILGTMSFCIGACLYFGRTRWQWRVGESPAYLHWERGIVIFTVLVNVLGLALLEDVLHAAGDSIFARSGMVAYLFGAVFAVMIETAYLSKQEENVSYEVVYVVLTFLAEAAYGVALLRTGLVAAWVGWVTIIWNLAWLVLLPTRQSDIYYPWVHYVAPLIIGIALLVGG